VAAGGVPAPRRSTAMTHYSEVNVFISPPGPDGSYAVRVGSDEGGQGHSRFTLPFRLSDLMGVVFGDGQADRVAGSLESAPAIAFTTDGRTAADFGALLFDALFHGEARTVFDKTESLAQSSGDGVRIRLSMDLRAPGMAEVASLPWELMCPSGHRPLVVSKQTPLVRSLDGPGPIEPSPFVAPLRILLLMANPRGSTQLNLKEERKRIENRWASLPGVVVDIIEHPNHHDVTTQLDKVKYHVIHYMGHGDFEAGAGGQLLMEDKVGNPEPVTGDVFTAWLHDERQLRLVFLNACNTGATSVRSGNHPFTGVATALIHDGIPAVVAMQFPISDEAAIVFAETFYERIARGVPVEAAVSEGRKLLYSGYKAEWATPVLYLRAKDGRLFSVEQLAPAANPPAPMQVARVSAPPSPPAVAESLRVYLATTDQDREKLRAQLAQSLRAIEGVQLLDAPALDEAGHAAQVEALVRQADLCIHLLGASPGRRIDADDDMQPLRTFPLEELRIAGDVARSQLVLMTSEDKESMGLPGYRERIKTLAERPRDKQRFEMVVAGRAQIAQTVLDKVQALKAVRQETRHAGARKGRRKALVDAHVADQDHAIDLASYLDGRQISAAISARSTVDLAGLDLSVKQNDLYVIVFGAVDPSWVTNRKRAILKAVAKSGAPLLVATYEAPTEATEPPALLTAEQMQISAMNDSDSSWVEALFEPAQAGRP
jgi:hypothetical protein